MFKSLHLALYTLCASSDEKPKIIFVGVFSERLLSKGKDLKIFVDFDKGFVFLLEKFLEVLIFGLRVNFI